ncbi:hypothetical protein PTTG_02875 [Puccinia triticina 1-1 BBBD Race 1]|uniref:Uncharacterized protein n=1 Tax=Puccinia triticina (isolate 1-1 / race 1 (BBBD)) TaxID=630390 RepID=A0A180GNS8_PUCT1|nr:hypothetical protein PTTG_02875 [Puccinia triticina 1-1 BBBD Race 1]
MPKSIDNLIDPVVLMDTIPPPTSEPNLPTTPAPMPQSKKFKPNKVVRTRERRLLIGVHSLLDARSVPAIKSHSPNS